MTECVEGHALADPADHLALAAKMEGLLDEETRLKMSRAARELALRHSFEKQAADFVALYEEVTHAK
jgi:glycosyltransferase involved in cell wall biosynthesis